MVQTWFPAGCCKVVYRLYLHEHLWPSKLCKLDVPSHASPIMVTSGLFTLWHDPKAFQPTFILPSLSLVSPATSFACFPFILLPAHACNSQFMSPSLACALSCKLYCQLSAVCISYKALICQHKAATLPLLFIPYLSSHHPLSGCFTWASQSHPRILLLFSVLGSPLAFGKSLPSVASQLMPSNIWVTLKLFCLKSFSLNTNSSNEIEYRIQPYENLYPYKHQLLLDLFGEC